MTAAPEEPPPFAPDDRVLTTTRVVSGAIVPVLTAAFVILFLFPSRTDRLWAWTIPSHMTAMLTGGGYLAGALFFARAAPAPRWHRLGPGFVATTVFTTMLLGATVLHWDEFNHDHVSFWAWLALYVVTPLLLPVLWARNQRFDRDAPEPGDRLVPARWPAPSPPSVPLSSLSPSPSSCVRRSSSPAGPGPCPR